MKPTFVVITSIVLGLFGNNSLAWQQQGYVGVESRYFFEEAEAQHSGYAELEWYWESNSGKSAFTFQPFTRIDNLDDERSHSDIREMFWRYTATDLWELRVGVNKVFWGVTESQHLVDIINQTDVLEGMDGEDKLGQPMVQLTLVRDWGVLDAFFMPSFRERKFPGDDGHLGFQPEFVEGGQLIVPVVNFSDPIYQSSDEENHHDYAFRYSHALEIWDLGLSYFKGTNRTPELLLEFRMSGDTLEPSVIPYYSQIEQWGADVQATIGSWLWKLEAIDRASGYALDNYQAVTAGFEYTLYGVNASGGDFGVLVEFNRNDRKQANTALQHDWFAGGRFTFNDVQSTELLFGVARDINNSKSYSGRLEASRRIGNNIKINIESWFFHSNNSGDIMYMLRNEDFAQVSLEFHF